MSELTTVVLNGISYDLSGSGGEGGQPKPITLASQMTDTNIIYLYLGSETGYDYGYIYAYVGNAWTKTTLYGKGEQGENGTATDAQVDAWLTAHPEATTTVQDESITPNKTTFIEEPYYYNVIVPNNTRGRVDNSHTTPTPDSTSAYQYTDFIDVDLSETSFLTVGSAKGSGSSASIDGRAMFLYKDGVYVATTGGTDKWASDGQVCTYDLSSYVSTVNQIIITSNYGNIVYITGDNVVAYTIAEITKTYFQFADGYKTDFYNALDLNNGGIKTSSIENGAVTGEKFGDKSIKPRKFSDSTNLIETSNILWGKYLGGNNVSSGGVNDCCVVFIPVEIGKTYTVNFIPSSYRFYGFYANNDGTGNAIAGNYTVSASSEPYSITVPNNANIKYLAISTGAESASELYDYGGTVFKWKVWESTDIEPETEYAFPWLKLGAQSKVLSSIFRDKIVLATGDSITENNTRNDNKSWLMYLPEKLGVKVYNDGKTGTGLVKRYQSIHSILYRVENQWASDYAGVVPDIVLIMGNMNDGTGTGETSGLNDLGISGWVNSGVLAVGTESDDINTQSVYGCAKRFLEDVIAMYPFAQIGWILSTPRAASVPTYWADKPNEYGHGWFEDYIAAIKYQCEQYNVPVLDLYHESGFRPTSSSNMNAYMDDGSVHPNTAGIKKYMVEPIVKWIEDKFGEVD